ncbi:MAG: oligopeptide/dipeptide ABC transporter ATP-binding protein, partial [Acidimicrobiales bacterium]
LCEVGDPTLLYEHPTHPYTASLLSAIPVPDPTVRPDERTTLGGEIPSPLSPPSGCHFRTRCPRADQQCKDEVPVMARVGNEGDHFVACHHPLAEGEELPVNLNGSLAEAMV